jgi:hypothetical protein
LIWKTDIFRSESCLKLVAVECIRHRMAQCTHRCPYTSLGVAPAMDPDIGESRELAAV